MSSPQTTSLSELLGDDNPNQAPHQNPVAQFAQMPSENQQQMMQIREETQPVIEKQPTGPGQGVSVPNIQGKKEFFEQLKSFDYKTVILVFAIILILSSGIFYSVLRPYVPGAVGNDGKVTLVGSLVAAIVGTLIFVLVKAAGQF